MRLVWYTIESRLRRKTAMEPNEAHHAIGYPNAEYDEELGQSDLDEALDRTFLIYV